jgi:RNA polymerase sigma-70 factor (ECF subfamily)
MIRGPRDNSQPGLELVQTDRPGIALVDRSDDELMTLSRAGHTVAMDVLVERHEARVFGFACKYIGDRSLAEEACQEAFVRLWQLRGSYDPRGLFGAFLGRLCLNACRELGRTRTRKDRALSRLAELQPRAESADMEEAIIQQENERRIEATIARLPARLKEAILLRFYSGLSYDEMEHVLQRPEATLRSRVHHGLKRLRSRLQEERP